MPKLPFSLFDFKHIDKIEPILVHLTAIAASAIDKVVYTVPDGKFALILSASVLSYKVTSTVFQMYVQRKEARPPVWRDHLIRETLGTTETHASWPPAKAPASWVMAWHLLLMWPGDHIRVLHALTAAETIQDDVSISRIEYNDPRYKE